MLALSIIAIVLAGVALAGVGLVMIFSLRAERTLGRLEERHPYYQEVKSEGALGRYDGAETRTRVS
jgi:hypothetical protein